MRPHAAKGADFEDLLEAMLGDLARGTKDLVERTGTQAGDAMRSKKGDFVITLDPDQTRGAELRVVVEAKDKYVSGRDMKLELTEAKANRNAAVALVVFTPEHAPSGIAPFDIRLGDVYCVIDPADPDPATLEAAVRLARLHAIATLKEQEVEVDAEAIRAALDGIRQQLGLVQGMKSTLTSTLFFSPHAMICDRITSFEAGTQWSHSASESFPAAPAVRIGHPPAGRHRGQFRVELRLRRRQDCQWIEAAAADSARRTHARISGYRGWPLHA